MNATIGTESCIKAITKSALDNRANQLNPNNHAYWSSRSGDVSVGPVSTSVAGAIGVVAGTAIAAIAVALIATHYRKKEETGTENDAPKEAE